MHSQTYEQLQDPLRSEIVKFLEEGFKSCSEKQKAVVAEEMLNGIFERFSFDLPLFLQQIVLTKEEKNRFLSFLLYEIYYSFFFFPSLRTQNIHDFLWVLLAETIKKPSLKKKLFHLSHTALLSLIKHCGLHEREGAWFILNVLEEKEIWQVIVQGIKNRFFDPKFIDPSETPVTVTSDLKKAAENEVARIQVLLPSLVEALINWPVTEYHIIEEIKKKTNLQYIPNELANENKRVSEQARDQNTKIFESFNVFSYSQQQMMDFFKVFGLRGYFTGYSQLKEEGLSLVDLLKNIYNKLKGPHLLEKMDVNELIIFSTSFCLHLHLFHHEPQIYEKGIKRIVYSLATSKADLPDLTWLPTTLNGLSTIVSYFQNKNLKSVISDFPITVFDQNEDKVFQKNRLFIERLSKSYGAVIWHLSKNEARELALRLGLEKWIEVVPGKGFGYGGARNCQFLLAPVIHRSIKNGCRSWKDLMKYSDLELKTIFDEAVLGKGGEDAIINVGEDDVVTHSSNCFTDALTSELGHTQYIMQYAACRGRYTMMFSCDLNVDNLEMTFMEMFPFWLDAPFVGGVKGMLSKPRFCYPLPFGNEETHACVHYIWREVFQQPVVHLSGVRYPQKLFPDSPLDALTEKITFFFPYTFQIFLSSILIDSVNAYGQSIAKWNQHPKGKEFFSNLGDLQRYVFEPNTLAHFRKQFWKNFDALFGFSSGEQLIKTVVEGYLQQSIPREFPEQLKSFYQQLKEDAQMFFDFGRSMKEHRQQEEEDPIENAKKEVEEKYGKKVAETLMVGDLYTLVRFVESFGKEIVL